MSNEQIVEIRVNLKKIKDLRSGQTLEKYAENKGLNPDMIGKLERGERWKTLEKFAEFCRINNVEPNYFFEITKKIS